jgi:recombination protein RecT
MVANVHTSATPAERQQQAIVKAEAKTALDRIRQYAEMDEVKKRFINLLGDRDGRAYVESVVIAVANSDDLQKCTPKSIMVSAMRAASLKLSVDPVVKQAHLVPFGGEAQLIVDYHGLVQMTTDTGYYEIAPNVFEVYEGEDIKIERFSGRVTIAGEKKSDEVIGWCGYFKAKNGTERWLYMTNEQADEHGKKYSKAFNSKRSGWQTDRPKMRR